MTRTIRFGTISSFPVFGTIFVLSGGGLVVGGPKPRLLGLVFLIPGVLLLCLFLRYRLKIGETGLEVRNLRDTHRFEFDDESLRIMVPSRSGMRIIGDPVVGLWVKHSTTDWVLCGATVANARSIRPGYKELKALEGELRVVCPRAFQEA